MMRHKIVVAGFTVAALVVAGPAFAQSTMTDKAKSVTQEAKTGMSDSWMTSKAKIDAKVDAGVVILTGEVKSIDTSARASEIARSVPGVRYVKNDLTFARSSLEPSSVSK
jgi:osmotically-inducible protein OsmY